jgi:SAM-dependent methyltransferase
MTDAHAAPRQPHVDGASQVQILDLDAEILADHVAAITAWLPVVAPPREIVDLGAGTGAGCFALLTQFPRAHLTAVDSSAEHLQHLQSRARATAVGDRVRTVQTDLDDTDWPDLGAPDLVWASASMHHMAQPDRALRKVRDILAPDGLFAVVELAGPPRFLPNSAPEDRPGLEERCHAAADRLHAQHVPHRGADWEPRLTAAGFTLEGTHTINVNIEGTHNNAVGPYALAVFQRLRASAAGALSAEDLAALDQLLDPKSHHYILRREDLAVRTKRTAWAARRNS